MNFKEFVTQNLTPSEFEKLPETLFCTKERTTSLLDEPDLMNFQELAALGELLGNQYTILMNEFNCGIDEITAGEYKHLLERNKQSEENTKGATIEPNDEAEYPNKSETIEIYLETLFEFRYNLIYQQPEYREIDSNEKFEPVDKRFLATLKRLLADLNITTTIDNIRSILESDFTPACNPVTDYLNNLVWNGNDNIKQLADTLTVVNTDSCHIYLKKWLIAVVANACTEQSCQNHTMLVLTSGQEKNKTTWLENLCPTSLKKCFFSGKMNPGTRDSSASVSEYFLINIDDQLTQFSVKEKNEFENLITTRTVKYRRPYDTYITEYPHMASFTGSVNDNSYLTSTKWSGRFLPFKIENINIVAAKELDIDQVWAQALHLWKTGESYFFEDIEIQQLHEDNKPFSVISLEKQLINTFYEAPQNREEANAFLQTYDILSELEPKVKQRLSSKKIGEALQELGFEKWQRTIDRQIHWVWSVKRLTPTETNDNQTNNEQQIY